MISAKGAGDLYSNTNNKTPTKTNTTNQIATNLWNTIYNAPYLGSTLYFLLDFIFSCVKNYPVSTELRRNGILLATITGPHNNHK